MAEVAPLAPEAVSQLEKTILITLAGMKSTRWEKIKNRFQFTFQQTLEGTKKGVTWGLFLGAWTGTAVGALVDTASHGVTLGSGMATGAAWGGFVAAEVGATICGTYGFLKGLFGKEGYEKWSHDRAQADVLKKARGEE